MIWRRKRLRVGYTIKKKIYEKGEGKAKHCEECGRDFGGPSVWDDLCPKCAEDLYLNPRDSRKKTP